MTVTISVPARLSAIPEPDATTTAVTAAATDIRTSATTLSDVAGKAAKRGRPGGWSGSASQAAGGAATDFSRGCDVAVAALTRAATALERYGDRLRRLLTRRLDHNDRVSHVNSEIGALESSITQSTEDDVDALRARSRRLQSRVDDWNDDARAYGGRI